MPELIKAQVADRFSISDEDFASVTTGEGYLVLKARIARTGLYDYGRAELGLDGDGVVKVYRPRNEVFDSISMNSFALKPVTDNHPEVFVDTSNIKKYGKGTSGDSVYGEYGGEFLRAILRIDDKKLIEKVKSGKVEVSNGYTCDIYEYEEEQTDEETGETYKFEQRNIRGNHIAIVDAGRAGPDCKVGINDKLFKKLEKKEEIQEQMKKTIVFDGIGVEFEDKDAQIVQNSVDKKDGKIAALEQEIATKDKQLGEKDAEIEELKKQIVSDAEIEKRISDRSAFISKVNKIDSSIETESKSIADLKLEIVKSKYPDTDFSDKSEGYVDAFFDRALGDIKTEGEKAESVVTTTDKKASNSEQTEDDPADKFLS